MTTNESDTMDSVKAFRKKVHSFFLTVFILAPLCGFICGFTGSVVYGVVVFWPLAMMFAIAGTITAFFCVLLSYRTLQRYNKAVAIIYCTTGTLIFGLIPSLATMSGNPLSWPAGIIGYVVGLCLLNFNIGVHRIDAFCNHVYSFFAKAHGDPATREKGIKSTAKEVGVFLLAIFIVGPFFAYLCAVTVAGVETFFHFFSTHVRIAIWYAMTAILFAALSYRNLQRYNPKVTAVYCMFWTLLFSIIPSFIYWLGFPFILPVELFSSNHEETFFHNTWPAGVFGYWFGMFSLREGIGIGPVKSFYTHVVSYFSENREMSLSDPESNG